MALVTMSVTGPSFQMSFAAVGGLIAFYETYRARLSRWHREAGPVGRVALYALGISLTTVICTVATAPYTIFHFNRFAVYSVAANVVAAITIRTVSGLSARAGVARPILRTTIRIAHQEHFWVMLSSLLVYPPR